MISGLKNDLFGNMLIILSCSFPGCVLPGSDTLPVFSSLALWRFSISCTIIFPHQYRCSTPLPLALYPLWLPCYGDCVPPCSLSLLGWLSSPNFLHHLASLSLT